MTLFEVGAPLAAAGAGTAWAHVNAPAVYWSVFGLPSAMVRVSSSYREVMDACGLTVRPTRWRRAALKAMGAEVLPVPPRRQALRPTTTGLRLRLRLAPGQEPADVVAATERLRHAWGVHAVHVTPVKPGVVELRLLGFDVLRNVRMPRRVPHALLKVPVALRQDGQVHIRDFRTGPHELVLGANGSGKSMYLRALIDGLAIQRVALVGIDCKRGVELTPFAPRLSALAPSPDQAVGLLDALIREMESRYNLVRDYQGLGSDVPNSEVTADIWGLPEEIRPVPLIVIVDEVAELFFTATSADEKRRDLLVMGLIRLAQLGRAAGVFLEVCGQRFGSELGKGATMLRAQLTGRVCHRVNDEASAKMALADISPAAVLAATQIPANRPGMAVVGDLSGGWSQIRTPERSLSEVAALCRSTAHMVPDVPALKSFRPTETLAMVNSREEVVEAA